MTVFDERAVSVGDAPWWAGTAGTEWIDLGQRTVTPIELQQRLNLTWEVAMRPLYQQVEGRFVTIPNRFSVTREDNGRSLGLVSGRYKPFQNDDIFNFFQNVTHGLAEGQVAGEFDGGARVWLLAKLPGEVYIAGSDHIQSYVLMTNSHDGKSAFDMFHTRIRVVCRNTLGMAMGHREGGYRLSHYFSKQLDAEKARDALDLLGADFENFSLEAEKLAQAAVSEEEIEATLQRLFPLPRTKLLPAPTPTLLLPEPKREELMPEFNALFKKRDVTRELIHSGKGNSGKTRWDVVNGVTEATDYVLGHDRTRAEQQLFGSGAQLKQEVWDLMVVDGPLFQKKES